MTIAIARGQLAGSGFGRRGALAGLLAALGLLLAGGRPALAGLAPLARAGGKLHLAARSALLAERDRIRYRLLPDRVEAEQTLALHNSGSRATFLLGLPLPRERWLGPQDVIVERIDGPRPRRLRLRRAAPFGWRPVGAWLACNLTLAGDERALLRIGWWQPHAYGELHGYPRLVLVDPVWTAGSFAQPPAELDRLVILESGTDYSASQPEAEELADELGPREWGQRDRRWRLGGRRPGDRQILSLFYKLERGATSRCTDADPWLAVDGDPQTTWRPRDCPGDRPALELTAQCRGFGTRSPDCDHALPRAFTLGVSLRTADGKDRRPVVIEGWWGRRRRWRVRGRQNALIPIRRREPLTRFRVLFPRGLPKAGSGEIQLFRLDPEQSDPGVEQVLLERGWKRTTRRCKLRVGLVNPVALRHARLRLKPGTKMDAFLITADCADGRQRISFHEPVPCHHSKAEIAEARRALGDPDLEPVPHKHYRRKHPLQIDLDLDPKCIMTRFAIVAPPVCTDRWRPVAPRVRLEF